MNKTSGDGGPATEASFRTALKGIFVDSAGNLYFSNTEDYRIHKVDTSGIITTVAGGTLGYSGDGGPATLAGLANPSLINS